MILARGDAPTFAAMASLWGLEPVYITKLTDKALRLLLVTARLLAGMRHLALAFMDSFMLASLRPC